MACGPAVGTSGDGSTGQDVGSSGAGSPDPGSTSTAPLPGSSSSATTSQTSVAVTTDPSGDSSGGSSGFVAEPDVRRQLECDLFEGADVCGREEVCRPWANDGGSAWNANYCVPLSGNGGLVGDPCTVEDSPVSGRDDCGPHSMCFDVDEQSLMGNCVAYCDGTANAPNCADPETTCVIGNDDSVAVCLPVCDPLEQDCTNGRACVASLGTFNFFCALPATPYEDAEGVRLTACGEGRVAVPPEAVDGCDEGELCCATFCDLSQNPDPCTDGTTCTPFGEPDFFGFEDIGVCLSS